MERKDSCLYCLFRKSMFSSLWYNNIFPLPTALAVPVPSPLKDYFSRIMLLQKKVEITLYSSSNSMANFHTVSVYSLPL